MFTLKNFRNVYFHGKQHSALTYDEVTEVYTPTIKFRYDLITALQCRICGCVGYFFLYSCQLKKTKQKRKHVFRRVRGAGKKKKTFVSCGQIHQNHGRMLKSNAKTMAVTLLLSLARKFITTSCQK